MAVGIAPESVEEEVMEEEPPEPAPAAPPEPPAVNSVNDTYRRVQESVDQHTVASLAGTHAAGHHRSVVESVGGVSGATGDDDLGGVLGGDGVPVQS